MGNVCAFWRVWGLARLVICWFFDVLYPDALFRFYHDVVGLSTIHESIFWGMRFIFDSCVYSFIN